MNDINQIRTLLDRWYGGESSPGDERMLSEFFASAGELPPDLEAARALFAAMSEAAADFPEIPAGLDARITSAVETEMARERRVARPARWRRILWAASGAAACLLAVVAAYNYSGTQDIHGPSRKPLIAQSVPSARPAPIAQPAPTAQPVPTAEPAPIAQPAPSSEPSHRGATEGSAHKASPRKASQPAPEIDTEVDTEALIAANYRVIEDEREADAILSSIFGRMEGNLAQETNRVEEISLEYDAEVNKLCSY